MSPGGDQKTRRARLTLAGLGVLAAAVLVGGGYAAAVLMEDGDAKVPAVGAPTAGTSPSAPVSGPPAASAPPLTPATGKVMVLDRPTGQKDGINTGFKASPVGGVSAAVYWWEGLSFLDDQKAEQQLRAMTSPQATGLVDKYVSEIRKLREGIGLPPSGGNTSEIRFTTSVKAARAVTVPAPGVTKGAVMEVWMEYDRYATGPDGAPDKNPLRNQSTSVMVIWQDGAWKLTNQYDGFKSYPVAYDPDSPYAWRDHWAQVRHGE
ncbi:hypothetical protein [Streptomyces sp. NPDC001389]|uniref:hypothetical protein n=1 Tax=Streptomyces sp. NPDC001389 TaxID=3364569 RepID=UPI00369C5D5E